MILQRIFKATLVVLVLAQTALAQQAQTGSCDPEKAWELVYQFPEAGDSRTAWKVDFNELTERRKLYPGYVELLLSSPKVKDIQGRDASLVRVWYNSCTEKSSVDFRSAQIVQRVVAKSPQTGSRDYSSSLAYGTSRIRNIFGFFLNVAGILAPFVLPARVGYPVMAGLGYGGSLMRRPGRRSRSDKQPRGARNKRHRNNSTTTRLRGNWWEETW